MGSLRIGTIDKCRHCKQRIRYLRASQDDVSEDDFYLWRESALWMHDPWEGQRVDYQGKPIGEVQIYKVKCNPEHLPRQENGYVRQTSAEPDSYCTELQDSNNETCFRRITDREFMKCGIHARPERQRQIAAEEARRERAARAERDAIYEYEVSLVQKDVDKLPPELKAYCTWYPSRTMRGRRFSDEGDDDSNPVTVEVRLYDLFRLLGIEE